MYIKLLTFISSLLLLPASSQIQLYKSQDLYGVKNIKGETIKLPIFTDVKNYGSGIFAVKANGKWGLIDHKADYLAECIYDTITPFKEEFSLIKFNDEWNFIDKFGNFITKQNFQKAFPFDSGHARVQLNDKWGIIDTKGQFKIRPIFNSLSRKVSNSHLIKLNENYGLLNSQFKNISDTQYTEYKWLSHHQIALIKQDNAAIYNTLGKFLLNVNSANVLPFSNKSIRVQVNKLWGIMDMNGKWLLKPTFTEISPISDNLARIKDNDLYGFIDTKGIIIFPPRFQEASTFSNGLAKINDGESWKWINSKGKVILTNDDTEITIDKNLEQQPAVPPAADPNIELQTLESIEKVQSKNNEILRATEIMYYNNYPGYFYRPRYRQRFINNCRPIIRYHGSNWNIHAGGCGVRATYNKPLHFTIKF